MKVTIRLRLNGDVNRLNSHHLLAPLAAAMMNWLFHTVFSSRSCFLLHLFFGDQRRLQLSEFFGS